MNHRTAAPPTPAETCLPGRDTPMPVPDAHRVNGNPLTGPWPEGFDTLVVGMGCFWGVERLLWEIDGVYSTAAGYAGGTTPNPTYEEACTKKTGHAEVVLVVFDPSVVTVEALLQVFWENHSPIESSGRIGNLADQYRSAIYTNSDEQRDLALASGDAFLAQSARGERGELTTEIGRLEEFYYAEPYHQQYFATRNGA